ncbi:MAG: stress response translation initiation inhibitor YciH [Desulfobacteraceae bacterium]|nr:stress response translation initiation inhibitor YciH [Desulfobacteraceae bacterium]
MNDNSRLVYSTESGKVCSRCHRRMDICRCNGKNKSSSKQDSPFKRDGIVRIQKEVKGRKGKCASVVYGLDLDSNRLKQIARELKNHCGTGGSVKHGAIIIQGDHREKIKAILQKQGFQVKLAGG